jgi:hypothetical protein
MSNEEQLRYPIGKFSPQDSYTPKEITDLIGSIESVPERIESIVKKLSPAQLNMRYRDGGWTARQVVHHISDSHMNAYIRFKWTLTESTPTIKAYDEKAWAETPETQSDPMISLTLLKALHIKWVSLLKSLTQEDLKKEFFHPDTRKHVRLDRLIGLYAWHGDHHLGHLKIIASK